MAVDRIGAGDAGGSRLALAGDAPSQYTLIVMGTGVAWAYRVAAALAPGWLPPAFRDSSSGVALYLKAVAAITVLALLDQALELRE